LRKKENALYEKVRMLVAYETLIRYNSIRQRGPSVVQLPAIIVGFSSTITGACNASLDGRSLEIQASENPVFYSPMDVFEKIGFPNANQSQTLRQFPELAALDSILFPSSRSA
jgi:hypothetical protein